MKMMNTSASFKNKVLAFFLALALAITYMPKVTVFNITAEAADEYTCGDYKFTVNDDGTATITDYIGTDTDITIPSAVTDEAGSGYEVKEIVISATSRYFCRADGAELINLTIPDGVTKISIVATRAGLRIENLAIGADVKEINPFTFFNHELLKTITVDENNPYYESIDNVLFTEDMKTLVACANTEKNSYTVPDSVEIISDCAFSGYVNLTDIIIPDTVTSMKCYAFTGCVNLKGIDIPSGVTTLSERIFWGCQSFTEITIPDNVTTIEGAIFNYCDSLKTINVESNAVLTEYVFYDCYSLTDIIVDADNPYCTSIDGVLFTKDLKEIIAYPPGKTATSYSIPEGVISIGNHAFSDSKNLIDIKIPDSVTVIDVFAFSSCTGLTNIIIPEGVNSIGPSAFVACTGLKTIAIPNSVTSIGSSAFSGCTSLTNITIPNSVTSIGENIFKYCSNLTDIKIGNGVKNLTDYNFSSIENLQNAVISEGRTSIDSNAFYRCTNLESVNIPDTVTEINNSAFSNCTSLTEINIPDSVKNISTSAFAYCKGLKEIDLSDNLDNVETWTFDYCSNLEDVTIGKSVTSINYQSFLGCDSLKSMTIPESVTSIDPYTFGHSAGYHPENLVFELYKDSYAEDFAIQYNIPYNIIGSTSPAPSNPITGTISGIVADEEVTVQLLDSSKKVIETVTSSDGSYSFSTNTSGEEYFILISMPKCAPREYSLTGSGTALKLDMEIRQYGDIHPDGVIDAKDATQILRYEAGLTSAFDNGDEYILTVANVVSTDELSAKDATQILRYEAGMISVFDTME